jgi:hypothetical protein
VTSNDRTKVLAKTLATERERAERYLWREMQQLGLLRADGWSIVEFTREAAGGTEIVLRPLHLRLPSPPGLECVVGIVEETARIQTECRNPEAGPER